MSLLQLKLAPNAFTPLSHPSHRFRPNRTIKIRAVGTVPDQKNSEITESNNEPPSVGFAFVSVSSFLQQKSPTLCASASAYEMSLSSFYLPGC